MAPHEVKVFVRQSLHTMKSFLSPVSTYFTMHDDPTITEMDRAALFQSAMRNLNRISEEIDHLNLAMKSEGQG